MTSSLVGSEMCIRDSHHTRDENISVAAGRMVTTMDPGSLSMPPLPHMTCLLYTSDAADDM
eukprot:12622553-Prorocentrum_lima.AAC.1